MKPTTQKGSQFLIKIETDASPQVFAAPCGISTKGIDFSASTNETNVPDCDDPDAPQWVERVVQSLSAGLNAAGIMAEESYGTWRDWYLAATKRAVRIYVGGLGYYYGDFLLTAFKTTGNIGEKVQVDLTMQNDGQIQWHSGL